MYTQNPTRALLKLIAPHTHTHRYFPKKKSFSVFGPAANLHYFSSKAQTVSLSRLTGAARCAFLAMDVSDHYLLRASWPKADTHMSGRKSTVSPKLSLKIF